MLSGSTTTSTSPPPTHTHTTTATTATTHHRRRRHHHHRRRRRHHRHHPPPPSPPYFLLGSFWVHFGILAVRQLEARFAGPWTTDDYPYLVSCIDESYWCLRDRWLSTASALLTYPITTPPCWVGLGCRWSTPAASDRMAGAAAASRVQVLEAATLIARSVTTLRNHVVASMRHTAVLTGVT